MKARNSGPSLKIELDFIFNATLGFLFLVLSHQVFTLWPAAMVFLTLAFWNQVQGYPSHLEYVPSGQAIRIVDFFERQDVPLSEIRSIVQVPSKSLIELRTEKKVFRVSRTIDHLILLQQLGLLELFSPVEHFNLLIRVSRYNIVMFVTLISIQLGIGALFLLNPGTSRWVTLVALLPSLIISFYLMIQYPLFFRLGQDFLTVKTLFGEKTYRVEDLTGIRTDQYFFGGGVYYLVRFEFGKSTVILDEFYLNTPIYLHRRMIQYFWIEKMSNY